MAEKVQAIGPVVANDARRVAIRKCDRMVTKRTAPRPATDCPQTENPKAQRTDASISSQWPAARRSSRLFRAAFHAVGAPSAAPDAWRFAIEADHAGGGK